MALANAKETHNTIKAVKSEKKQASCLLSHEPNEETKQAIREARQGIGVTTYKTADEMWKALEK